MEARSPGMATVRAVAGAWRSERVTNRREILSSTVRRVDTDDDDTGAFDANARVVRVADYLAGGRLA